MDLDFFITMKLLENLIELWKQGPVAWLLWEMH